MNYNKQDTHPGFLKTREETEVWLDSMGIENYTINDDLTVDVDGGVWLYEKNLDYIPVQFCLVDGGFYCQDNNLTSLKGCPTKVAGVFACFYNNITSLEHCPIDVGGWSYCSNNMIVTYIPKGYHGKDNPSWGTDDPELISSRFFDKLKGLDSYTKVDMLNILKEAQPGFYNSAAFQAYNPDSMLGFIKRSKDATGGLFEL